MTPASRRARLVAAALAAVTAAAVLTGCGGGTGSTAPDGGPSSAAGDAQAFLHSYVARSGRVVRHDQGGDTVSEGQGYALLLAYAVRDRATFARVWRWTRTHLQAADQLFAYHWDNGHVVDDQPAADADTQIAWALDLAGHRWSLPADTAAARRIAGAIAAKEVGYDDQGHPTLAAGPWAVQPGQPVTVEPGYWTYPADVALADLTGDHRWEALAASDAAHAATITRDGRELPPDWAVIGNGSAPAPASPPGTSSPPQSGQDGLRALVWTACIASAHNLDARWWSLVSPSAAAGPLVRSLAGPPANDSPSPLSLVAAAAAAQTAGQAATASSLLTKADQTAKQYPTYYGTAWAALGRILLTTNLIPGCNTT